MPLGRDRRRVRQGSVVCIARLQLPCDSGNLGAKAGLRRGCDRKGEIGRFLVAHRRQGQAWRGRGAPAHRRGRGTARRWWVRGDGARRAASVAWSRARPGAGCGGRLGAEHGEDTTSRWLGNKVGSVSHPWCLEKDHGVGVGPNEVGAEANRCCAGRVTSWSSASWMMRASCSRVRATSRSWRT